MTVPEPSPLVAEKAPASPAHRPRIIPEDGVKDAAHPSPPIRSSTILPVPGARHTNRRRSQHLLVFMGLVYASTVLLIGAFGLWFHSFMNRQMDERLVAIGRMPPVSRPVPTPAPSVPAAVPVVQGVAPAELEKISNGFKKELADIQSQLVATQKRLAEAEQQNQVTTARLKVVAENASSTKPAPSSPTASSTPAANPLGMENNALGSDTGRPPSQPELVLLKERNRLTAYADEAIATGAREPYERLWAALDDPRLANLIHAARAEILRVQNYYLSGSRLERFDIPVAEYYPDNATLRDAQLPDDKLISLMSKESHPWQVRLKAANLLGMRRSTAVGNALVETIKKDKNLDVVKEATFSFEQMTGYRAKLFEPTSVESWWKQYNASPPPTKAKGPPQTEPVGGAEKGSGEAKEKEKSTKP